jgi:multiple sugar transport system ATP-binding protein
MRKGELQQVASPQELYDRPVNLFVGGFIGSPAMNMVESTIVRSNGGFAVTVGSQSLALDKEMLTTHPALAAHEGKPIVLGIRPEDLEDAALEPDSPGDRRLRGKVGLREALGSEIMVHFTIDAKPAVTDEVLELAEDSGDDRVPKPHDTQAALVGRFGARSRVRSGADVEVAVDTRALHFFDPQTGLGIYDGGSTKGAS